ncbi:hypothetical protein ACFL0Y_02220 [Patescibacteria group bacterium]
MNKNIMPDSLGVFSQKHYVYLFYHLDTDGQDFFRINFGSEGFYFETFSPRAQIFKPNGQLEKITDCRNFRISTHRNQYFLTYQLKSRNKTTLYSATSHDLISWQRNGIVPTHGQTGVMVNDPHHSNSHLFYFGEKNIRLAYSYDLKDWQLLKKPIFTPPDAHTNLKISGLYETDQGWVLIYSLSKGQGENTRHSLEALLIDPKYPQDSIWFASRTIWKQSNEWSKRQVLPVGCVFINHELISYWQSKDDKLFALSHPYFDSIINEPEPKRIFFHPVIKKFKKNPILEPIAKNSWESKFVFNPAAIHLAGKVHLVYRAVGDKNISVLGYASSQDGIDFDIRLKHPIYLPQEPFESNQQFPSTSVNDLSGPGCGGCEDPRITKIEGKIYLTYNAWNGYEPPRVALLSINQGDFANHRWNWDQAKLISQPDPEKVKNPDRINKNWAIFPNKIKGKYAILHSLDPIQVDYFDNLNFDDQAYINDSCRQWKPRKNRWDIFIRGIGPPPIEIDDGWLLFYHAVSKDFGYNVGAMVVDRNNPTKVLYRSKTPIVEPRSRYENEGFKAGVVYSCGAVIKNHHLFLYYGGADTVICTAEAPLNNFLKGLKTSGSSRLEPVSGNIH